MVANYNSGSVAAFPVKPDGSLGEASAFAAELRALAPLCDEGLAALDGARLALSPLGRRFARNVAMAFDRYLPAAGAQTFSRTV